jgi:hypothetical protein
MMGTEGGDGQADMAMFGRQAQALELLTAIISERDGIWEIAWVGDGSRQPRRFEAASLTEATDQATTAALALWASGPQHPDAELQLAIYPWDYGDKAPMYDVTSGVGMFYASDLLGSGQRATAPTLEDLVTLIATQPLGDQAMLRWVRKFADLPAAALE